MNECVYSLTTSVGALFASERIVSCNAAVAIAGTRAGLGENANY